MAGTEAKKEPSEKPCTSSSHSRPEAYSRLLSYL
jgi:hypothetical protein